MGLIVFFAFRGTDSTALGTFKSILVAFYLISPLSVFAHELGHALAAIFCRFRVFTIELGWKGKELFNIRIRKVRWILRWFPSDGICRMAPPSSDHLRLRLFLVIAAGPLINLVFVIMAMFLESRDTLLSLRPLMRDFNPVYLLFWMNLFILFSALRPKHYKLAGEELLSDGLQLLKIIKNDQTFLDETHKAFFIQDAAVYLEDEEFAKAAIAVEKGLERFPNDTGLEVIRSTISFYQGEISSSLDILETVLEKIDHENPTAALIKNNIAYFSAVLGDEQRFAKANLYSKEALQAHETASAMIGTRGSVLVRLGEIEEGMNYLKRSIKGNSNKISRGENLGWIALAHYKLGNLDEAAKHLQEAKALYANSPLIAEVEGYLNP